MRKTGGSPALVAGMHVAALRLVMALLLLGGLALPAAGAPERDSFAGMTWAEVKAMGPESVQYYVIVVMQGIAAAMRQTGGTWPEETAATFRNCSAHYPRVLAVLAQRTGPEQDKLLGREQVFTALLAACKAEKQAQSGPKP